MRVRALTTWPPHRDGTTHVVLDPMDFVARLAALAPPPRVNLTRYHGLLAPPSRLRGQITAARRGRGGRPSTKPTADHEPESSRLRQSMTWAPRLRRVFNTPQGGLS